MAIRKKLWTNKGLTCKSQKGHSHKPGMNENNIIS